MAFNESDRLRYVVPSTPLFHDFCEDLVERYGVGACVRQGAVVAIEPIVSKSNNDDDDDDDGEATATSYRVTYRTMGPKQGERDIFVTCDHVIVAIGTANLPRYPEWALRATARRTTATSASASASTTSSEDDDAGIATNVKMVPPKYMLHSQDLVNRSGSTEVVGDAIATDLSAIPPAVRDKLERGLGAKMLVVGGGLTSAHLALRACKMGFEVGQ